MGIFVRVLSLAILVACVLGARDAQAASDTYVSASGADAGDCQIATPCVSLRRALAQTAPGGTITILTSGRYGPVDITKSVHIMADGVTAVINGLGKCNAPVCVDAGPDDVVSLRGLTINVPLPYKYPTSGILFNTGAALHVDHCQIGHLATFGIAFYPQSFAHLHVFDSKIGASGDAIDMLALGPGSQAVLDDIEVHDSNSAITIHGGGSGPVQATIRNSLISSELGIGVLLATSAEAVTVAVMIDHSVIASAENGVRADSRTNTIVRIDETTIAGQDTELVISEGGTIASYGDNHFVQATDGVPFPTVIPLK